jgi:hypothetical protein
MQKAKSVRLYSTVTQQVLNDSASIIVSSTEEFSSDQHQVLPQAMFWANDDLIRSSH